MKITPCPHFNEVCHPTSLRLNKIASITWFQNFVNNHIISVGHNYCIPLLQRGLNSIAFDNMAGTHDGVIKWKYFQRYWPVVRGIHRSAPEETIKETIVTPVIWDAVAQIMHCNGEIPPNNFVCTQLHTHILNTMQVSLNSVCKNNLRFFRRHFSHEHHGAWNRRQIDC